MIILRVEHKVAGFDKWKAVFDSDPINRKAAGVRRYRVARPTDDPDFVIVDLEFDTREKAEAALQALRGVWSKVQGNVMFSPSPRILDLVEAREY